MIVLCVRCGRELEARASRCGCAPPPQPSHMADVFATAAALGGVTEENVRRAADALRQRES